MADESGNRCLGTGEALDFVDGSLLAERREQAEQHIDGCDECRRLIAAIIQSGTGPRHADASLAAGLEPGTVVGRYIVGRLVGRGGMGVVYEARDPELERPVALKLLSVDSDESEPSRDARGRLLREARALAQLSHPNIVAVYDVGEFGDDVYIAMELIDGSTLRRWLEGGHSAAHVLEVIMSAGRGLAAAHARGLVHRDVKPDNIIVGHDGHVRLVDFGLVRAAGDSSEPSSDSGTAADDLTRTGETVGTPAYMAPEQRRGGAIDPRADQFAFCVTACQALSGEYPLDRSSGSFEVRATALRAIPARLRRALLKGLSPRAADRFETMDALLATLSGRVRRRRLMWAGGAAATLVLAGGIAVVAGAVSSRASPVCADAERHLDGVWDPEIRRDLEASFQRTRHPRATETFARVAAGLDGYASDWIVTHTSVCRDTRVHRSRTEEVLEVRMRCLESSLARGRVLIGQLRGSLTAQEVDLALPAALSLPPAEACAALVTDAPDARLGVKAKLVRERIARADALVWLGRFTEAAREAAGAESMAREAGEPHARCEAMLTLGHAQAEAGEFVEAEATLRALIQLAAEASDDRAHAEAWTYLEPVLTELGRYAEAIAIEPAIDAAIARAGGDPALRARALRYQSEAHGWKLDYAGAVERADQSVTLAEEAYGLEHPFVAEARANLAEVLSEADELSRAAQVIKEAVAQNEKVFGPEHPKTARSIAVQGRIARLHGEGDVARALLERAVSSISAGAGAHPELIYVYREQGWLELDHGNAAAARDKFELALARTREIYGGDDYRAALHLADISDSYFYERRFDEASKTLIESVDIRAATRGAAHISVGYGLQQLGRIEFTQEHFEPALAYLERALPIFRSVGETEAVPMTEATIAACQWELGRDRDENIAAIRRARRQLLERGSEAVALIDRWLARKLPERN